jgi:hypothetical protein
MSGSEWINQAAIFEVIEAAVGYPASIFPDLFAGGVVGLDEQPAFLGTWVLARRAGPRV